jgi:hypothetical protein
MIHITSELIGTPLARLVEARRAGTYMSDLLGIWRVIAVAVLPKQNMPVVLSRYGDTDLTKDETSYAAAKNCTKHS